MFKTRVLICDKDESYLNALVRYLIASESSFDITCFSEEEAFLRDEGEYDVKLMTENFIELEANGVGKKGELIQLTTACSNPIEGVAHFYKFQNMNVLIERLLECDHINNRRHTTEMKTRLVGIFSPVHHNLIVPFSMVYSKICRQEGKVLYINLGSEMSMSKDEKSLNLTDYLYAITEPDRKPVNIEKYTVPFQGISCLMPSMDPEELWDVSNEEWENFMKEVKSSQFETVILMIPEFVKHFVTIASFFDDLMLVGGDDPYSSAGIRKFHEYLIKKRIGAKIQDVILDERLNQRFSRFDVERALSGDLTDWIGCINRGRRAGVG